nr:cupin domain-containing protein [Curvibacter sp. CHRR-16]
MYRILPRYFEHKDARGSIAGLLNVGVWREMNLIASDAGATRGHHYHKETQECFVVLVGKIHVVFRRPLAGSGWEQKERIFVAGEVFIVEPTVEHTFHILEASQWINLLSKPVDTDQPDFHKYAGDEANT